VGITDHIEQGIWLCFTVNNPTSVELLMTAMLRVHLREHEQFNICGRSTNHTVFFESVSKVLDF
jgi:hypothetical protein